MDVFNMMQIIIPRAISQIGTCAFQGLVMQSPDSRIFQEAITNGFQPLIETGIQKVAEGISTMEELIRITDVTESLLPRHKETQDDYATLVDEVELFNRNLP